MPNIVLTDVVKRWKDFYATDHVNLDIPDKAFVTLLGPSGCGKTTILRMIAGLETPTSGQIKIGDQIVFDSEAGINVPANKRKVGFLFQNYALWPNMTVYQNIAFGLKNVKEELYTYDYDYKTRCDVIRILSNPKKVISLVNDARDKKGRIVDKRAIIKIIDEFTVSQYTANEIFKLHLEEGGVDEKVNNAIAQANSTIENIKNKYLAKDIFVEEDGKLVHIKDYASKSTSLSKEELDNEIKQAYELEKVCLNIETKLDEITHTLSLRGDSKTIAEKLSSISEISTSLNCVNDITNQIENISKVLPNHIEVKEKLNELFKNVKDALPFLGEDYQKLVIAYLRKEVIAIATSNSKEETVIAKDLNSEVKEFNTQVSNQLSAFIDKMPRLIASASLDKALEEALNELSYLPDELVSQIKEVLVNLSLTPKVMDKKEAKAAEKRLIEGLSAINVEDRPKIEGHLKEVPIMVSENEHIKTILNAIKNDLSKYNEDIVNGVLDEFKAIIVSYVNLSPKSISSAVKEINKIANYLVEETNKVIDNCKVDLSSLATEYGASVNQIQESIVNIRNSLTSIDNKASHLKSLRGLEKEEIELSLRRVARIVKVEEFMDRYPNELSGGQQQRVAIARTLAPGPKVLFMDEPLSNLDAKLRLEMRSELKRLHVETGATFVYVTHDQLEAMTLATHICLLDNGVLQQYDAPLTIYNKPNNLFVADFVGNPAITLIEVKARANEDGNLSLSFFNNRKATYIPNTSINLDELRIQREKKAQAKAELLSMLKKQRSYVEKGNKDVIFNYHISTVDGTIDRKDEKDPEIDDYVIGIRPEYFTTQENGTGLKGEVYSAMPSGMETTIKIAVDGYILTSVIFGAMDYTIGETIHIDTKSNNILLFDKVSGELISSGTLKIDD